MEQLLALLNEHERFLVALIDRRTLRLLRVELGELTELPGIVEPDQRAIDTLVELGGFERRAEEATRAHHRRSAEGVEHAMADRPSDRLILGGPDEAVAGLQAQLGPAVGRKIVGRASVSLAAPQREILDAVAAVVTAAERQHEVELVEELRQRAAARHGAVVGLEPALAALTERRVETLLASEDFAAPGARCPSCGWLGPGTPLRGGVSADGSGCRQPGGKSATGKPCRCCPRVRRAWVASRCRCPGVYNRNTAVYTVNMARRPRHQRQQVEEVLQEAEATGFTVRHPWGHWGALVCPEDRPLIAVFSTPRNADNHAKKLRRAIDRCPHIGKD